MMQEALDDRVATSILVGTSLIMHVEPEVAFEEAFRRACAVELTLMGRTEDDCVRAIALLEKGFKAEAATAPYDFKTAPRAITLSVFRYILRNPPWNPPLKPEPLGLP